MNSEFFTLQNYKNSNIKKSKLTPSMEDYLEMIYRMYKNNENIRINILSHYLNVQMSSTTKIIQRLAKMDYVIYIKYGNIQLTELGKKTGEFLLHRHNVIEKFLSILLKNDNVLVNTEIIEHYVNKSILISLENLISFYEKNPDILDKYNKYLSESIN